MPPTSLNNIIRNGLLILLVNGHAYWMRSIRKIVPDPYLDEVFHIPQAQAYWAGNFTVWDPKITTPPGLYVYSTLFGGLWKPFTKSAELTTSDLRWSNWWLLWGIFVLLILLGRTAVRQSSGDEVLWKEISMVTFPLLVFFSGLYYTDLLSTFAVVLAYACWAQGVSSSKSRLQWQLLHFVFGLVAIGVRQTNIFWVAVFLGGLQVRETAIRVAGKYRIFDPPLLGAYLEDFLTTSVSIFFTSISDIPTLLVSLWPQIALLSSFAFFVYWNGGVVLGDKTNHIASLHLPQLLYLWPTLTFFSWPLLLPHLLRPRILLSKFPRLIITIPALAVTLLAIHYNTLTHPFTLADNRHYPFYTLRLLLTSHPLSRYLAAPIYFFCAFLVFTALQPPIPPADEFKAIPPGTNRVSFFLIWLVATTLSLVTSPLYEPRYFIIPWLAWRLHVPSPSAGMEKMVDTIPGHTPLDPLAGQNKAKAAGAAGAKDKASSGAGGKAWLRVVADFVSGYVLWIELAWMLVVNVLTGYVFLYRGFEWLQEPGRVQRFMW